MDTDGTVNVQVNDPIAVVVCEVHVWVDMVPPEIVMDPIAVLTEKPAPVTVTEVPTLPLVGARVMLGVVTVNVVDAVSDPPSFPVITTVYPPAAIEGTV